MTIMEAKNICWEYRRLASPGEEDDFLYIEALKYLIETTKNDDYMVELGAFYYERRRFDLAVKYYEMAAEYDNIYAISDLGYIWYYGRTGQTDYEKAFRCFDRARRMGDLVAAYKVADMYKNGYFVEKDPEKYRSIIGELYEKLKDTRSPQAPVPEVFTRLAGLRAADGDIPEALRLYDIAREVLSRRIQDHPFFGDLNIMKRMIEDVYRLRPFDPAAFGLYDLYYVLRAPAVVRFTYRDEPHEIEAAPEDGGLAVRFDEDWYRSADRFFQEARLDGVPLTSLYDELFEMEVL